MNEDDLVALLHEHAARHAVPGAAVGVLHQGAAMTAYSGVADVTMKQPVTSRTRFAAGSLTKSMVATVIARLAAANVLSLDDPVAGHVPELAGRRWAEDATVRDLLGNRSGLPLSAELEFGFAGHTDADDGALARLAAEVGAGVPTIGPWSYTNLGWCLLGRVIERATGVPWEAAMRHHLFDRAGMSGTTFANELDPPPSASGYDVAPSGPVPVKPVTSRAYGPAGTTVLSTITDLLLFAALHLEDPSLASLRVAHAEVSIYGWLDAWCLGWARFDWIGGPVWGWDGLIGGERSILRLMPEQQAAVVLLTNASTGRAMYRSLFPDLMGPSFGITVPPLHLDPSVGAAGELSRFAGTYAWPDRRVEVTATARGLLIKTGSGETEALPLDERAFLLDSLDPDNPTITFGAFDADGRPHVLYSMLWGLPRIDDQPA